MYHPPEAPPGLPWRDAVPGAMNERGGFPTGALLATIVCVALVNVVAAQVIVAASGGAGFRVGAGGLIALAIVGIGCGMFAVRGWRAYLREQRRLRNGQTPTGTE